MSVFKILLIPFWAWAKAYNKSVSEAMEMEEPYRSMLLEDIFFPRVGG